ncbi:MAG TPA: glycosyltransferase family 2 protein [Candidatus Kapabacteria bacterium]|nr:glycosyltransferase family 2 protein [Candidatus Kapabacteria bacterium]
MGQLQNEQTMVSVVIPAFNEAQTISTLIASVRQHPHISEVIVVDDGSTDTTAHIATAAGATVISLPENRGKGNAMDVGVLHAKEDIICFLDADVLGITHAKLSRIIDPVRSGKYDMFVGIRGRRSYIFNKILRITPILGGERAIRRVVWEAVPLKYKKNYQIEIALNYHTKINGWSMGFTIIPGLIHIIKEKKLGFFFGFLLRLRMNADIVFIGIRLYLLHTTKRLLSHLYYRFKYNKKMPRFSEKDL